MTKTNKKIAVLDFGGQYAHLIAASIRNLGAYCEIVAPHHLDHKKAKQEYAGLIYSGGPNSVYDKNAPVADPQLTQINIPLLAICYGQQLIIQQMGGEIKPAKNPEYGPASLIIQENNGIFSGEKLGVAKQVWMSHGDIIESIPPQFKLSAKTKDCPYAALSHREANIFALQFHPEVRETECGMRLLANFIRICGLTNTWKLSDFLENEKMKIKEQLANKKVFFLLSGGVDSTVAFALIANCLEADNLIGLHIDTGFMRHRESEAVKTALQSIKKTGKKEKTHPQIKIVDASEQFYTALQGIHDPEEKRHIIGRLFVEVQQATIKSLGLNAEEWFLGQGTIYPDTIESGSSKHSKRIKTHHNRVEEIEILLKKGRVIEPISSLYKDEVRKLGRLLKLPEDLLERHPFPGPGLAVRCLCSSNSADQKSPYLKKIAKEKNFPLDFYPHSERLTASVLPLKSVGVQGDKRSYKHCLALFLKENVSFNWQWLLELAREIPNQNKEINRVVIHLGASNCIKFERKCGEYLSHERIALLRQADHILMQFLVKNKLYDDIWQFPVISLPIAKENEKDKKTNALVLRPVSSNNAMTASVYCMKIDLLFRLHKKLLSLAQCNAVFYDLTTKPPGTIEWE